MSMRLFKKRQKPCCVNYRLHNVATKKEPCEAIGEPHPFSSVPLPGLFVDNKRKAEVFQRMACILPWLSGYHQFNSDLFTHQ